MKTTIVRLFSFSIVFFLLLAACSERVLPPVNMNANGIAIKGYDAVAYFTEGKPIQGWEKFQHTWNKAKWIFSSEENLKLFQENPENYAPQYGGY